ncbi:Na K-ATPase domain containing protein [Asbolus verrucosus]|uniref:Na K-ATPase domain containing protein n=1 Tax=Asbolus verrucosus TaxID=1661398 RepID=A0A482VPR4_ASBVE|nr:Na K-ATPase domain containing protein [Asbolus verrucosus]
MQGLLALLDDRRPRLTLDESLIGTNPGLGFRPISSRTEEGSLIWYDIQNHTTSNKWVNLLDEFLDSYVQNQTGKNYQHCDFNRTADDGNVCMVDLEQFGPCSPTNVYGYNGSSPCVFLKLNKIYGWEPEYYTEYVEEMPEELQIKINNTEPSERNQVWISCEGTNPVDKENLHGFEYHPKRGFPSYYFPYTNTPNYLSPLIAVQVLNPQPNVLISVECRAWAKNINYRGGDLQREGSISFEILIDDKDQKE